MPGQPIHKIFGVYYMKWPWQKTEVRAEEVSWDLLSTSGFPTSASGVTPTQAENLATVLACIQVISSSVASLPAYVFKHTDNGRDVVKEHPLMQLIQHGPNQHQTWPDFVEFLLAQALLNGNSLTRITTDERGQVVELLPIPWANVSYEVLPGQNIRYRAMLAGTQQHITLLSDDVVHLRDRSDDGLIGKSRLTRAGSAIRTSLHLQQFSESLYQNGTAPSGALTHDQKLSKEAVQTLRSRFEGMHSGSAKAGTMLILDNGLGWTPMSISPEDAELLDSRKFSTEEIARIYGCPPPLVGIWDHSSFTNSETAGRWFSQFTLTPWVKKIEAAIARAVFTDPSLSLEIDLSGFMRGDPESRWKSHKIAVEAGILTTDEIREVEGWAPRGGKDDSISI
ncbi:MAG: phage portal protein [Desulfobacteraceae bacterium]|nr:phage portal protein [Desulfobacteraceae bacterium]